MKNAFPLLSLVATFGLAACGGASGSAGTGFTAPSAVTPVTTLTTAATSTSLASAQLPTPARGTQTGFVNSAGHAVYVFDLDLTKPGTSQCNDVCAQQWPPLALPAGLTIAAPWGTIARSDGTMQLTFSGHPLYLFIADQSAGTAVGDGVNAFGALWHLAQPQ